MPEVTLCNHCESGKKKNYVHIKNTKHLCNHFFYIIFLNHFLFIFFVIIHNMLSSTWKQRQHKVRRYFL